MIADRTARHNIRTERHEKIERFAYMEESTRMGRENVLCGWELAAHTITTPATSLSIHRTERRESASERLINNRAEVSMLARRTRRDRTETHRQKAKQKVKQSNQPQRALTLVTVVA